MSKRLKKYSTWLSALLIATGMFVLPGWQFDFVIFKQSLPDTGAMYPMTAFSFAFSGSALLMFLKNQKISNHSTQLKF